MKPVNVWSEFQPLQRVILGAPFPPDTFDWHQDDEKVGICIFSGWGCSLFVSAVGGAPPVIKEFWETAIWHMAQGVWHLCT